MFESSEQPKGKMTRRNFIKTAALGIGAAAGLTTIATETDKSPQEGVLAPFNNPVGRFFPIYEVHADEMFGIKWGGISPKDYAHMPSLDILFSEMMGKIYDPVDDNEYEVDPTGEPTAETTQEEHKEGVYGLNYLNQQIVNAGGKIAYGDIETIIKNEFAERTLEEMVLDLAKDSFMVKMLPIIEGCFGYAMLAKLSYVSGLKEIFDTLFLNKRDNSSSKTDSHTQHQIENFNTSITKRAFIRILGIGIAAWALSPAITGITSRIATSIKTEDQRFQSLKHVLTRLNGIQSKMHPELLRSFVADIFFGIKLLNLAESEKKELNRLPNIGFHAGAGHSGTEDWLVLGKEFIYQVIELFPVSYMKFLVEANNGSESLASIRMLSSSPDGKKIRVKTVVDQKLKGIIDKKLEPN